MLPRATLAAGLFHGAAGGQGRQGRTPSGRACPVRAARPRRRPEYGIEGLLARNLEHPSAASSPRSPAPWIATGTGQDIAAAWIAKEKLRDVLNLQARVTGSVPCQRQVRDRLFAFYDWCAQHDDIPSSTRWPRRSPGGRTRSPPR
jgi:hypothetical protein